PLLATYNYAAGQFIVRRGQVVDRKVKAALDQLREKAVLGQLQPLLASPASAPAQTVETAHIHWLIGALVVAILILVLAVWHLARRRHQVSLLPVPMAGGGAGATTG